MKVLELTYRKGDLAMLILLPETIDGLSALESKPATENLSRWLASLGQTFQVSLPDPMTAEFQLADVLSAMGMSRAFTLGEADFSMSRESLFVSEGHPQGVRRSERGGHRGRRGYHGHRVGEIGPESRVPSRSPVRVPESGTTGRAASCSLGRLVNPQG